MSLLVTEKLNKSYGSLVVTHDLDLRVAPGQRHVIIGPNGAGKTSLLGQIGGQIPPSSGRIYFKDKDITQWTPEARLHLGMARTFQQNNCFRRMTALENVRLAAQARHGNPFSLFQPILKIHRFAELAEQALAKVGLLDRAYVGAANLSYGELRQLEIAVALAGEPDLLLLDEPTSGLSPSETQGIIHLIEELPKEMAIIMIEHDLEVVFAVADHITVLYYGEVLASGTPDEISRNEQVREIYLGVEV
jgi:branched-chain amino acid transport system ATP-binding protein